MTLSHSLWTYPIHYPIPFERTNRSQGNGRQFTRLRLNVGRKEGGQIGRWEGGKGGETGNETYVSDQLFYSCPIPTHPFPLPSRLTVQINEKKTEGKKTGIDEEKKKEGGKKGEKREKGKAKAKKKKGRALLSLASSGEPSVHDQQFYNYHRHIYENPPSQVEGRPSYFASFTCQAARSRSPYPCCYNYTSTLLEYGLPMSSIGLNGCILVVESGGISWYTRNAQTENASR